MGMTCDRTHLCLRLQWYMNALAYVCIAVSPCCRLNHCMPSNFYRQIDGAKKAREIERRKEEKTKGNEGKVGRKYGLISNVVGLKFPPNSYGTICTYALCNPLWFIYLLTIHCVWAAVARKPMSEYSYLHWIFSNYHYYFGIIYLNLHEPSSLTWVHISGFCFLSSKVCFHLFGFLCASYSYSIRTLLINDMIWIWNWISKWIIFLCISRCIYRRFF